MSTPRTQRGSIARRMWFTEGDQIACPTKNDPRFWWGGCYPVAVLDLRPEAVEKMVEAVASKMDDQLSAMGFNRNAPNGRPIAEAVALAALSCILPLRKRGKR